jgi:hypothetical protein
MRKLLSMRRARRRVTLAVMAIVTARLPAVQPQRAVCEKVVITGDVSAGQEWKASIGEGWVFRVLPIDSSKTPLNMPSYTGWDLVVDREQPAGFPDALLLATPPYGSINEREMGTTFGVRAQDAIGWNPRSFRFLTNPESFRESQRLYQNMSRNGLASGDSKGIQVTGKLMELVSQSSAGQLRILDARLTPGIADAAPFAENWALQSAKTPHTAEPAPTGKSTALGTLAWVRFSITLWLPGAWKTPSALHAIRGACSE